MKNESIFYSLLVKFIRGTCIVCRFSGRPVGHEALLGRGESNCTGGDQRCLRCSQRSKMHDVNT